MFKYLIAKLLKKIRLSSVRDSSIHRSSKIESGSSVYHTIMDRYSFCGYDCDIFNAEIGSFTSIASQVVIGGARHPKEWVGMSPVFYKGRDSIKMKFSQHELTPVPVTSIGNDVWIGRSAIIMSGVRVGNGAVIGAGAIVTKDVPPYAIVAGNPAKLIRYRLSSEMAYALENTKWWLLNDENLNSLAIHIKNPEQFVFEFNKLFAKQKISK